MTGGRPGIGPGSGSGGVPGPDRLAGDFPADDAPWAEWRRMLLPLSGTVRNGREATCGSSARPAAHTRALSGEGRRQWAAHVARTTGGAGG